MGAWWVRLAPLVVCGCSARPLYVPSAEPRDAAVDAAAVDAATPRDAAVDLAMAPDADVDAGGGDLATTPIPHDTCAEPLDVSSGGSFLVDMSDKHGDYLQVLGPLLCGGITETGCRDIVLSFHLDEAREVSIVGDAGSGAWVSIALRATCDEQGAPIDTARGYSPVLLRHRALPAGTYFVFVGADPPSPVLGAPPPLRNIQLDVSFSPVTVSAGNETCATALDLGSGGHVEASFVDVTADVGACGLASSPDLVYRLTLAQSANVRVAVQAHAYVDFTLRTACDAGSSQTCFQPSRDPNGSWTAKHTYYQLPAGSYFLILEDWGHREPDFTLDVDLGPATPPPHGDTCTDPLPVELGVPFNGSLAAMQDEGYVCGSQHRDAFHTVTLTQTSDVWIAAQGGNQSVRVGLLSSCDGTGICNGGGQGRAATYLQSLAAGTYTVMVGSDDTEEYQLSVEAWPPNLATPTSVNGNESCATAYQVPSEGGVFIGDTTTASDDTDPTACDRVDGLDVAFRWTTPTARRVFVTTSGSSFAATVEVRDATCVELACDGWNGVRGSSPTGALDLTLPAGTYVFVVDGQFASAHGPYRFELRPL